MASLMIAIAGGCVWVILSAGVGNFADKRGHSGTLWYLFSLLFSPIVGFAFVAALPSSESMIRQLRSRQCPHCSAPVAGEAEICPACGRELATTPKEKIAA